MRPATQARHEARILEFLNRYPDANWRQIVYASGISSPKAKAARDRLLAQGRIQRLPDVMTGGSRPAHRYRAI